MSLAGIFRRSRCRELINDIIMNQVLVPTISTRQKTTSENHHLWNNHGSWWFHGTEHRADGTAVRIRVNLRSRDIAEARRKRDRILNAYTNNTKFIMQ
jgi:hypothetical protein